MVAYVIAEIDVTNPVQYEEYKKLAPAAIAQHGGRYLVRGGTTAPLEGDWRPGRIVVLEFPTLEQAKKFHTSVEYTAARRARAGAATMKVIAVEGI